MNRSALVRTVLRVLPVAALCCVVGSVALAVFGLRGGGRTSEAFARWPFIDMWIRWDAGWYQAISTAGYSYSPTEQSGAAYFPAYPVLIRGAVLLGANPFLAGMVLTCVCGIAALFLFRLWSAQVSDPASADRAQWVIILWPFAYYLYGAIYSDALFLALIIGAFLCLERRWLWTATLLGALATATRPIAPAVVLGLCVRQWELRRQRGEGWSWRDAVPALSVAGLVAFMVFLDVRFGNPIAFVTTQAGWAQAPGSDWFGKFSLTASLLRSPHPEDALLPLFHLGLALAALGLGFRARKRLGWGYAVYVWSAMGIPLLATRDFMSLGRYALAAFPSFLMLSQWLSERPRFQRAWFVASSVLLAWMVSRFALGHYVA